MALLYSLTAVWAAISTARSNSSILVGSGVGLEITTGADAFCCSTDVVVGFADAKSEDNLGNGGAGTDMESLLAVDVVGFATDTAKKYKT